MSKVRARPESGSLYFDFQFRGQRCREYSSLADNPVNRRKMEAVLKRIESAIALNAFNYASFFPRSPNIAKFASAAAAAQQPATAPAPSAHATPLLRDFAETWRLEKQIEWRQSYRETVDTVFRLHLMPVFGDKPVNAIDRAAILSFRAGLITRPAAKQGPANGKPRKPDTLNRIIGILRQVLDEAAARYGFANPATSIKRLKAQKVDITPFTMDEVKQMIDNARPDYRDYLLVRFFTGMRSAEVHGLKWKHIDLERGLILIRETFYCGRTEYTKNDGSQRDIQSSQPVMDALRRLRAVETGRDAEIADQYVFHSRYGNPIINTNFNDRIWKPLLRLCGIKYRRPYQMRHTCATLWLAAGESPQWIANQLGHTTTEMLFRTYGRYVPNLLRRDGVAFDRLVSSAVLGGITATPAPEHEPTRAVATTTKRRRSERNKATATPDQFPMSQSALSTEISNAQLI